MVEWLLETLIVSDRLMRSAVKLAKSPTTPVPSVRAVDSIRGSFHTSPPAT